MKLAIAAIGKPGRGPEAALADDYARRATLSGRPLGLGPLELIDLEPKKPGKAPEAEQGAIADKIQQEAYTASLYGLTGQYKQLTAYRKSVEGLIDSPIPLFWNVSKK